MIKITFELSEEFVRENAKPETLTQKVKEVNGGRAMKELFNMIGYAHLEKFMNEGKTEFVVSPDKLDEKSNELFNNEIGEICMLAAFAEMDKV